MRYLFTLPLLVALVIAYPYDVEEDDKTVVTTDFYPENLVIYEGKHDIVDILFPLNSITEDGSSESHSFELSDIKEYIMIFFVEAETKEDGSKDHSIYVYKKGKATKVMDKGRAIAAAADDSQYVYLGGTDGLYVYNPQTKKANKYGNFESSIKDMAKEQNNDIIYILTEDRELYKVYDAATKKLKIDYVKDAEQIMMDYSNNLYYYGEDKKPYVRTADGQIKKIEHLPEGAKDVKLFRPPIFNNEGVEFLVDNDMYVIYPDGSSQPANIEFMPEAKPTAYSMEAGYVRYFGYNKKIYQYDLMSMIDSSESDSNSESNSKSVSNSDSKSDSKSDSRSDSGSNESHSNES